jgi:hypothetical protein
MSKLDGTIEPSLEALFAAITELTGMHVDYKNLWEVYNKLSKEDQKIVKSVWALLIG